MAPSLFATPPRSAALGALLFALFAWAGTAPASAAEPWDEAAAVFVQTLADDAVANLTSKDNSKAERIAHFRRLFKAHFAVRGIGQWILGRHWKKANPAEQEEYLALFEDLMVVSYVDRFAQYAGESLHIHKSLTSDAVNATVFSEIHRLEGTPPVRVDWRVQRKGDEMKIVDVVVEGSSMSNTLRSDFSSIIRQKGGRVAGLLEALREKTAWLKKDAG